MTRWCSVRGRGRTALTAVAALAACVSLTSSVDAGVVGYYNSSPGVNAISVSSTSPALFSFTTGTASSLTQLRVMTNNAAPTADVTIKLYQYTGILNGGFDWTTAPVQATWQFADSMTGGSLTWNTFDLTDVTKLVSGSAAVSSGTQYVLAFATSLFTSMVNDGGGDDVGTDGWATYGGFNATGGLTGSYRGSGSTWSDAGFQWEVTFGATAVPGAGVAGLSVVGLAGLRRRRR